MPPANRYLGIVFFSDILELGGEVDGYSIEHATSCESTDFQHKIQRTLALDDTGLSQEYIDTFQPNGYLKVYAR